jgi:hypothetical protein
LTDELIAAQCPAIYPTPGYRGMWSCSGCGDGECDGEGGDDQGVPTFLCDANLDGEVTKSDVNATYALVKRKRARYPMVLP